MRRARLLVLVAISTVLVAAGCGGADKNSVAGAAGTQGQAAKAFPPGTLLFVDANADLSSGAWQKVRALLAKFPSWAKAEQRLTTAMARVQDGASFDADVKPWLGDEAAIGVLGITLTGGSPKPQLIGYVASKDDAKAAAALRKAKRPWRAFTSRFNFRN